MKWVKSTYLGHLSNGMIASSSGTLLLRGFEIKEFDQQWETIDSYVTELLGRLGDKAASLLTFNSIFADLSFAMRIERASAVAKAACLLFTISCVLLISCIYFFFTTDADPSFEKRFSSRLDWVFLRVQLLTCSLYVSVIGVVLVSLFGFETTGHSSSDPSFSIYGEAVSKTLLFDTYKPPVSYAAVELEPVEAPLAVPDDEVVAPPRRGPAAGRTFKEAAALLYLDPAALKALKRYALDQNTKVHSLLLDAVERGSRATACAGRSGFRRRGRGRE